MASLVFTAVFLLLAKTTYSFPTSPQAATSSINTAHPAPTIAPLVAGCGLQLPDSQVAGGESYQVNFTQSNGRARTYRIHIPSNYNLNEPTPLIFSFHANSKSSKEQEILSQFSNETVGYNQNAFAVYPEGLHDPDGHRAWQGDPRTSKKLDDIGFVEDLIADFQTLYCIDPSRIYASGKSNGGAFATQVLACDPVLSTLIAAFAGVATAAYVPATLSPLTFLDVSDCLPDTVAIPCLPGRDNIPILDFHGSKDKVIPYQGGVKNDACLPDVGHWAREWAVRNGLGDTNSSTRSFDNMLVKEEFGDGEEQGLVTLYRALDVRHWWMSTTPNDDNPTGTYFDATPIILDFFNSYSL